MNKQRKLTRNAFKRKMILMGAAIFGISSLVTTGLASWVISRGNAHTGNAGVNVGTVTDAKIEFENISFLNDVDVISFDSAKDDITGRVTWNGSDSENLSVTIKGTVTNVAYLASLTIEMEKTAGLAAAEAKNYIVLPECANTSKQISISEPDSEGKSTFSYTITFAWGSAFEGKNPSIYFDQDQQLEDYTDEEAVAILEDLKYSIHNGESNPVFKVTITATATTSTN